MKNKIGLLFAALLMTSTVIADNPYNNAVDVPNWGRSPMVTNRGYPSEMQGPSKEAVLKKLQKKLARGQERISLIEQEISCVQDAKEGDGSIWRCYEIAQQKKQLLKQKIEAQRPYKKRKPQGGGGVMPNFDNMGMGIMPMPW
ncbi:MAG: hypothetical protein HN842_12440 [Gammaproteobacteria bacterium]|jgi:hypothetical protein|nr:hypothetical protein [Gammaproteobacteria bacterium]MBT7309019.1 hypothetical protein [Gammaproteobacteria bacterium]